MKTNATMNELQQALNLTNASFDDNIRFKRLEQTNAKRITFTLTVKDSSKAGHRLGFCHKHNGERRKLVAACWHVHGTFFDHLFSVNPLAYVWSGRKKITVTGGNWEDRNIGSQMYPLYFSEACDC